MIQGEVTAAYEAVVSLTVRGPRGETQDIEAVVDTGFTGFLTLPSGIVVDLGLSFVNIGQVTLADGSEATLDVYRVAVVWDGEAKDTRVYAADTTPLVGMRMLDGHNLNIDVEDGGSVVIQAKN